MLILILRFNGDVSSSLAENDLLILLNGIRADPENVSFAYDPATRTGTWKLAAAATDILHIELPSSHVTDSEGRALDGDDDGSPGGTYLLEQPVPIDVPADASAPNQDR